MLPDSDIVRLRHMLDAALEVMEFAEGRSRLDLNNNPMFSRAVVRDIEIIGEAANKITQQTRDEYPTLPWASIIGMRNRLIHGYFDVDLDRLWDTITIDLPELIVELRRVIQQR